MAEIVAIKKIESSGLAHGECKIRMRARLRGQDQDRIVQIQVMRSQVAPIIRCKPIAQLQSARGQGELEDALAQIDAGTVTGPSPVSP